MSVSIQRVENGVLVSNSLGQAWVAEVSFDGSLVAWQTVGKIVLLALGDREED